MAGPRILIVEDEEVLVKILVRALPKAWSITTETESRKALKRLLDGETFDVIVLDLMIPHLTGMGLFNELKEKRPELCEVVVFCTGARYIPGIEAFLSSAPNNAVVEKPYDISEIVGAVSKVLARSSNGSHPPK